MKRVFLSSMLLILTAACSTAQVQDAPPPSGTRQLNASRVLQYTDIRQVDFCNFTLRADSACTAEEHPVQIRGGEHRPAANDASDFYLVVEDVIYGDLTGDGHDEAVVRLECHASSVIETGVIYTLRDGQLFALGSLDPGHQAEAGIVDVRIENGLLIEERLWSAHPPTPERIYTFARQWNGREWIEVGRTRWRRYTDREQSAPKGNPCRLPRSN